MRKTDRSGNRRLVVHRETLRALTPVQLEKVAGGHDPGDEPKTNAWTAMLPNMRHGVVC